MTGDADAKLRAVLLECGTMTAEYAAYADAYLDETGTFDDAAHAACAWLALAIRHARWQRMRAATSTTSVRFDEYDGMTPAERVFARQYNAALDELWRDRVACGDATHDAVLDVARQALTITRMRLAR